MSFFVNALGVPLPYSGASTHWYSAAGAGPDLYGSSGNDSFYGASGVTMHGGAGDDIYYLYAASNKVAEAAGAGIDTISTWMSYKLPDNVENLVVTNANNYAFGNGLDNIITAKAGHQTLDGGAGNDVLIDGGAELELGWLPPLLQNARNAKLDVGKPGRVQASQGIRLMNVPTNVTRAAGDVHALGNPHFAVDPIIAKAIAQHIAQSFAAVDPPNAATYDANYKKFEAAINAKLQQWGATMLPFKGQHVAAYHDSWPYFAHRFGLKIDVFLEPLPGTPPSPSHLTEVIQKMKRNHIKLILVEPYQDRRIAEKVARAADASVIDFTQFPGGIPGTDNYVSLINQLVKVLADDLK